MTTIYHNPRCRKSREAIQILQQANEPVEIVLYLNDPISEDALKKIIQQLGVSAIDLVRKK
jgi:arsenate reductase